MDAYEARLSALAAVRGLSACLPACAACLRCLRCLPALPACVPACLPALPELQWSECPAVASCYRCNLPRLHLQMGALGLHPAWTTWTCSRRCLRLLESHQLAPGLLLQTMMTLRQDFDVYKAGIDGM